MKAKRTQGIGQAYPVMPAQLDKERQLHKGKEIVSLSQGNWNNDKERTIHSYGQDFGRLVVKTERK